MKILAYEDAFILEEMLVVFTLDKFRVEAVDILNCLDTRKREMIRLDAHNIASNQLQHRTGDIDCGEVPYLRCKSRMR